MLPNRATTLRDVLLHLQIPSLSDECIKADNQTFFNKYRPRFPLIYVLLFICLALLQGVFAIKVAILILNTSMDILTIFGNSLMVPLLQRIIKKYVSPKLQDSCWKKCRWDYYKGFVPNDIKRRALEIKDLYPSATFFIHWLQRGRKKLAVLFFVCDTEGNQYPLWNWQDD